MNKRYGILVLAFIAATVLTFAACGSKGGGGGAGNNAGGISGNGDAGGSTAELVVQGYQKDMYKDVITIRGVRPATGVNAVFEQTAFGPQYRMWVDEVNQAGGLYVKSLDRQVKIDIQVYDDGSDITKTSQLFEQIVASEKPDLIIAPEGTAALLACAPSAQKYNYLLLAAEGGVKELAQRLPPLGDNTNTFSVLNYSDTQVPALIKFFLEVGVQSVYCVYNANMYGTEYWGATMSALEEAGIDILGSEPVSVPLDVNFDADAIVKNAMKLAPDAFLVYTYSDSSVPITKSMANIGYNPDFYLVGPDGAQDSFGPAAFDDFTNITLNGMFGWGGWNENSTSHGAKARAYSEHFREYWQAKGLFWKNPDGSWNDAGNNTVYQDWWSHICYYSVMQVLQEAVENAGELMDDGRVNNLTLVKYIDKNAFNTAMHPALRFTDNILTDDMYLGNIGQWQNGVFEVMDCDSRRTAEPWYPKPEWE